MTLCLSSTAWLSLHAGGVRGKVADAEGVPLAFATIFVKETGSGTAANQNGFYEIRLNPGRYTLVYQYLGYESIVREAEIQDDFLEINITLKEQVIMLRDVTITAGQEDPAYTIMRKAIAKAPYHINQLEDYTARVYMKGTGRLKDYPWIARRALEKEGIDKDRVFITESVSDIHYQRPNTYNQNVISIRSDGNDNNTSPNVYIFGSFYNPTIAETVSPLSPRAFSYYHFEYLGTFTDRDYSVSRIRVTPRAKGDNVVEGIISIVEDSWCIHSLDLITTKYGVRIGVQQIYEPVAADQGVAAWLPVSHHFNVNGKFFGFEFEYHYLATVSDYRIELNPDLPAPEMEVIDEKIEKQHAREIQDRFGKESLDLQQRLDSSKEITRKELRTMVREYEKEDRKSQDNPEVIADTRFHVDSTAYKKDSTYWQEIRPVPLTADEIRGYAKVDSLARIEKLKESGDTLQERNGRFNPWDLLIGDSYRLSDHSNLQIDFPMVNFNTVEGPNIAYKIRYGSFQRDSLRSSRFNVTPTFRYAFSRNVFSGNLNMQWRNRYTLIEAEGGRYVRQFNHEEPILPIVNTITTLLLERNLMKIYEGDYFNLHYRRRMSPFFSVETTWDWDKRQPLQNSSAYKLVNRRDVEDYTPNEPQNVVLDPTLFPPHKALTGSVLLQAKPWQKVRIHNGRRHEVENSSPVFSLEYTKGFNDMLGSVIDYDRLEAGYEHHLRFGLHGSIDLKVNAGRFINRDSLSFIDFKHFPGNQTPFMTGNPLGDFRLLDYYTYSTDGPYLTGSVNFNFRRLIVTAFPVPRLLGIRENLFVNYLQTREAKHYAEFGYAVNGILRLFRLELVTSTMDGQHFDYGVRIGIASGIAVRFND